MTQAKTNNDMIFLTFHRTFNLIIPSANGVVFKFIVSDFIRNIKNFYGMNTEFFSLFFIK